MSRCDHELTCLCHSLETVSDREAADRTGRVQITDPGNVVVGHDPTERTLTLHVARELPVVPVPVVIQVETVPVSSGKGDRDMRRRDTFRAHEEGAEPGIRGRPGW